MVHALIVGSPGVGKSTLIRRIRQELGMPVFGYETKKEDLLADPEQGSPLYFYPAGKNHVQSEENLIGFCGNKDFAAMGQVFDRFAPLLRGPVPEGHLVLLDEIGYLEREARDFQEAVLSLLSGDAPLIAAVKDKEAPFLNRVRTHPKCRCFYITEENRDSLYSEVLQFLRSQLPTKQPVISDRPRKTLIINGSPRPDGNTAFLIRTLRQQLPGPVVELSAFRSRISPCVDCRSCWDTARCVIKDDMELIYEDDFDNVVLASPIYYGTLPGSVLSLMSRMQPWHAAMYFLNRPMVLREKKAAAILTAGGKGNQENAMHHISALFRFLNAKGFRQHTVISPNTDTIPAQRDLAAQESICQLARWLSQD